MTDLSKIFDDVPVDNYGLKMLVITKALEEDLASFTRKELLQLAQTYALISIAMDVRRKS